MIALFSTRRRRDTEENAEFKILSLRFISVSPRLRVEKGSR